MSGKVVFIVGPTAAGKTEIALKAAEKMNAEIISADSMQVYRGMDIGTAKASAAERERIKHHLIDIKDPSESFSVHEFRQLALKALEEIQRRGKLPLIVGGSGLYIQALLDGLSAHPGGSAEMRAQLEAEAAARSLQDLYAELLQKDPETALKIQPGDKRRIIRALEIIKLSGKTPAEWHKTRVSLQDLGYSFRIIGISMEREALYQRIEARIDAMFSLGLLKEVAALAQNRLSPTARQALGYKELLNLIDSAGEIPSMSSGPVQDAVTQIKKATRNFAKRQMTWFRRDKRIEWIDLSGVTVQEAINQICSF